MYMFERFYVPAFIVQGNTNIVTQQAIAPDDFHRGGKPPQA